MSIYRLKVLTCGEHEESHLKDLYFNVSHISGFYIPETAIEDQHLECDFVMLCHFGEWTTVKQEAHIIKYLTDKFVNECVVNEL